MNDRRIVTLSCVPEDPEQARKLLEQIKAHEVEVHPDYHGEVEHRIADVMAGHVSSHAPDENGWRH